MIITFGAFYFRPDTSSCPVKCKSDLKFISHTLVHILKNRTLCQTCPVILNSLLLDNLPNKSILNCSFTTLLLVAASSTLHVYSFSSGGMRVRVLIFSPTPLVDKLAPGSGVPSTSVQYTVVAWPTLQTKL